MPSPEYDSNESLGREREGSSAARRPPSPQRRARSYAANVDEVSSFVEQAQNRIGDLVAERPWAMVGAAAGVGLVLGAASRTRASNEMTRMVTGTASGIAVRYALNALTQWFERGRQ